MGWRSKVLFLIIIYFSGAVSAIYYVAPGDENCQANDKATKIVNAINYYGNKAYVCGSKAYDKVSQKVSQVDKGDLKTAYNRGVQAINNMQDKYSASNSSETDAQ